MRPQTFAAYALRQTAVAPQRARRNTSIGGLSFAVEIEGQHVAMRISESALKSLFGAGRCSSTWLAAYRLHAGLIDAKAAELHRLEPHRPVCLEADDFQASAGLQA